MFAFFYEKNDTAADFLSNHFEQIMRKLTDRDRAV